MTMTMTMTTTTKMTTTDAARASGARPAAPTVPGGHAAPHTNPPDPTDRRRPRARSIRVRIVVGYVALLAGALAISIVVTRQVLLARLDNDIDEALTQEVEELRLLAGGTDPATGEPFGTDVEAILTVFFERSVPADDEAFYALVDGRPFLRSFDAPADPIDDAALVAVWADADEPVRRTVSTSAGEMRYLAVPLRGPVDAQGTDGTFVVAHFPSADRDEVLVAVRVLTLAGATVLVISALIAWSLAGRVLRPVRELTATARRISDSDLSLRIPVTGDDELAELGRTFNEMVDRLQRGFTNQRAFLDDVAHELRTPITIVRGHLEVAGTDAADRAVTTEVMTDELDRMSRYVDDLLLLAKAEQPDFLRLEPIDLGELANAVMQRLPALGDRSFVLDQAPPPGHVAIVADPGRLSQAVLNLASNAVQHTNDGDEIGVAFSSSIGPDQRRTAEIRVRDTGPGIDPTVRDTLFDRHARAMSSRASRPDGAGIGLSIVAAIATAHGGSVSVADAPGGGSIFTITIPEDPER
jgi:signal transduction histidine kinase